MDLVLVDACHLFDYVMSDSRNAFRLLGRRGAVLWHDFGTSRDVVRALQVVAKKHDIAHIEGTSLALHCRGWSLFDSDSIHCGNNVVQGVA
jgi:hypothetical protein